jgi:type II secretory pathway component GspD/PulD (secretin)
MKAEAVNNIVVVACGDTVYRQILALMREIDVPPRQVMFEAEAVEVSRSDVKNLGVDWGSLTAVPSAPSYETGNTFRIQIGHGYGIDLKAQINRLIEQKKGRLLASPRIAALDGQTAQILIGDRLAVENRTIVGGSELITVTYVDVGIKLEVTPFVNDDNTITTRIRPEVSNKADVTKNGNPNIRTRQSDTTLRVRNGETIVLGGLIQREEIRDVFKVPILGDIPLVGQYLFRTTSTEKRETELVILITPKMIGPNGVK